MNRALKPDLFCLCFAFFFAFFSGGGGTGVLGRVLQTVDRHEKTQVKKENDRTRLTHMQNANAGPVFLTYRTNEGVDELVAKITR